MVAIAAGRGLTGVQDTYRGTAITVADGLAWAVLEDLVIATTDRPSLEAALDAEADARPSLADDAGYAAAMRRPAGRPPGLRVPESRRCGRARRMPKRRSAATRP